VSAEVYTKADLNLNLMLRSTLILFCFFLLSAIGYSQSSFDISFAPGLGYFHGLNKDGAEKYDLILENSREGTRPSLNWRVGVHYNQQLSERWFLRSGLRWADLGYKTGEVDLRWPSQHNGQGGFDPQPGVEPTVLEQHYHFQYLEIPLLVRFQFGENRWRFFVEAGAALQYLAWATTVNRLEGERLVHQIENDSLRTFVGSIQTGLGLAYQPADRWQFFVQTNGHYQLPAQHIENPIQYRLWQVGGEFGARYLLGFN
jgi:hypothetical protein